MERLTFDGNFCDIALCSEVRYGSFCEDGSCSQRRVWERLKQYEDTGLEPEEVEQIKRAAVYMMFEDVAHFVRYTLSNFDELQKYKALGDYNRLRELKQADDEGRCVVLPAKPDQTIYQWRIGDDCPSVSRLDGVQINADGEITYPIWNGYLIPEDFGKTVFFTRGEAALRRERE